MKTSPRVVVPYVTLHPVVRQVLDSYRLPVSYICLGDDDAYRRVLQRIWAERRTVILVEQDIVPWPGAIDELWGCMGEWCACSYNLFGGYGVFHSLGCTKLSAALMAKTPDVWEEPRHWNRLDAHLFHVARAVGQEPHPHRPPVIHLNVRDTGQRAGREV